MSEIQSTKISQGTIKKNVESAAVETIRYNYALGILTVTFNNGTVYDYLDVPVSVYGQITAAESHGRAFISLVKNNYDYIKVNRSGTVNSGPNGTQETQA